MEDWEVYIEELFYYLWVETYGDLEDIDFHNWS
jgi:hypothetical protein